MRQRLVSPVTGGSHIVRVDDVTLEEVDGRTWLVDGETGERTELSAAGAVLWAELDGTLTLEDVAQDLGLPLADTIEFVRRLRANGVAGDAATERRDRSVGTHAVDDDRDGAPQDLEVEHR